MKKILIAALALSCSTAFAGNAYVGVGVGSATQKLSQSGISLSEDSTAASINAGYQFTPMFGAEAGYVNFGEATVKGNGVTIGAKPKSFYLAGTATFPVSPAFSIFAKAGAARSNANSFYDEGTGRVDSQDDSVTNAMFGIGASYAFNSKISAIVEYGDFGDVLDQRGGKLKVSHVSAGVRFSF